MAPVKVLSVMEGDRDIPLDTPFPVHGMWLRDIKVVLQNTSTKTIVSGGVILSYPETGDGTPQRPLITTALIRGRRPDHAYMRKDGTLTPRHEEGSPSVPLAFAPGATLTLTVGAKLGDLNQATITQAAGNVSRVTIQLTEYYFDDASMWISGNYFAAEPPPERYRKVTLQEFSSGKGSSGK
jgi:hypothetical protein